jgi:hypothetical protein
MTAFVLVVLAAVVAVPVWALVEHQATRTLTTFVVTAATGCAVIATLFGEDVPEDQAQTSVIFAAMLCVAGGGLAVVTVFEHIDAALRDHEGTDDARLREGGPRASEGSLLMSSAAQVLRGGAWIGALERLAVFVSLLSGVPEGVAVVLAIKGLGRYPELRAAASGASRTASLSAVAERFIIGTLVSFLWAAACVYVVGPSL